MRIWELSDCVGNVTAKARLGGDVARGAKEENAVRNSHGIGLILGVKAAQEVCTAC
jgi:hypothetical protein